MKYNFRITAVVEADNEKEALEKINAGVDYQYVDIEDGPDEEEPIEDDDEEITTP